MGLVDGLTLGLPVDGAHTRHSIVCTAPAPAPAPAPTTTAIATKMTQEATPRSDQNDRKKEDGRETRKNLCFINPPYSDESGWVFGGVRENTSHD